MITRRLFSGATMAAAALGAGKTVMPAQTQEPDESSPPVKLKLGEMDGNLKVHPLMPGVPNIIEYDPTKIDGDQLGETLLGGAVPPDINWLLVPSLNVQPQAPRPVIAPERPAMIKARHGHKWGPYPDHWEDKGFAWIKVNEITSLVEQTQAVNIGTGIGWLCLQIHPDDWLAVVKAFEDYCQAA